MKNWVLLIAGLMLTGCAAVPSGKPDPRDPWERFNRASFKFNDALDRAIARPIAKAYVKVTPRFVRTGVGNAFSNLDTVTTIINDALQGKVRQAGRDSTRFLLNSTLGLGGLFDPATPAGFENNDEDFGQTLGKWGVPSGAYLMVPLFGPTTVRDGLGSGVDVFTDPVHYVERDAWRYGLQGMNLIDARARRLPLEDTLNQTYDKYGFIRNAFLQQREFQVTDGNAPNPTFDEPLEDPDPEADKK